MSKSLQTEKCGELGAKLTCHYIFRCCIPISSHYASRNMSFISHRSIFCKTKVREFCIIFLFPHKNHKCKQRFDYVTVTMCCFINLAVTSNSFAQIDKIWCLSLEGRKRKGSVKFHIRLRFPFILSGSVKTKDIHVL